MMNDGSVKKVCWTSTTEVDQNPPPELKKLPNLKSRTSKVTVVTEEFESPAVVDQEEVIPVINDNNVDNQISCSGQCLLEVTNLPVFQGQKPTQGEIELSTLFKEYGAYSSLKAFNTKKTKSGKMEGIAYVAYKKQQLDGRLCCEAAREAIEKLNRTEFQEKMLYIRSVTRDEMDQRRQEEPTRFKQQKMKLIVVKFAMKKERQIVLQQKALVSRQYKIKIVSKWQLSRQLKRLWVLVLKHLKLVSKKTKFAPKRKRHAFVKYKKIIALNQQFRKHWLK